MRWRVAKVLFVGCLIALSALLGCGGDKGQEHRHGHSHAVDVSAEFERGPHGGRMLREGDFALELKIFEVGVPPQFRVYGYHQGKQTRPTEFSAQVQLSRLGRPVEKFEFSALGDFLSSDKEVYEPHSFDVVVEASFAGRAYRWSFPSYEGRTTMSDAVAQASGVGTATTSSRELRATARLRGTIVVSEHRIAHVIPRFAGVVRESRKHVGDVVRRGDVLAIIESNESLQPFEVKSQIDGVVVQGHVVVGEFIPENQWIYVIADLSEVWADFRVPVSQGVSLREGRVIRLTARDGEVSADSAVSYVAPYVDEASQSQLVRAVIANPGGEFLPGMFVVGDLVVDSAMVKVAVRAEAIQKFRDWQVVFRKVGETYEIAPLELGRRDHEWIEVVSGLAPGDDYVTDNSFLIKADILKSGAHHDH